MQSTSKALSPYAIRAYLPADKRERKAIKNKLSTAAKQNNRSVSEYVLLAAIEKADRDLAGREGRE